MKPPSPTGPHSEPAEKQDIASKGWSSQDMKKKHPCGFVERCRYLEVFLHAIQEDHFGPEFFKLGLELGQHQFAIRPFGIRTLFNRSYWKLCICVYIEFSGIPNLYFFFLVESTSGRNFSFSSDSLFQLSAAAAVPVQRTTHKSYRRP